MHKSSIVIETLTPNNKSLFLESFKKLGFSYGPVGETICKRQQPIPNLKKPVEGQVLMIGSRILPGLYKYGTQRKDPVSNLPLFESDGTTPVLDFTKEQVELFEKDTKEYNSEFKEINKVKSTLGQIINFHISNESGAKMKGFGLDMYENALKDCVDMLILIELSHNKSSDSNLLTCVNNVSKSNQAGFTNFATFYADFTIRSNEFRTMLMSSAKTQEETVDQLLKCFLLNNIDPEYFKHTINVVQSSKSSISLTDLSETLMNFYNNNSGDTATPKTSALIATAPAKTEHSLVKCAKCKKDFEKVLNFRSKQFFKLCKTCYDKEKEKRSSEPGIEETKSVPETKSTISKSSSSKKKSRSKAAKAMSGVSDESSSGHDE